MTPISWVWLWRGLQGKSITFAALFGSLVLGASISRAVHHLLSALGFHWLWVLLLPILLFTWMADQEAHWVPNEQKRRVIALSIILGSTAISMLITRLTTGRPHPAPIEESR